MILLISTFVLIIGIVMTIFSGGRNHVRDLGVFIIFMAIVCGFFVSGLIITNQTEIKDFPREQFEIIKTKNFILINTGEKEYFLRDVYSYTIADTAKRVYIKYEYNSYGLLNKTSAYLILPK
jgi:hypothetical protein